MPAFSPAPGAVDHEAATTAVLTTSAGQRLSLRSSAGQPGDIYAKGSAVSVQLNAIGEKHSIFAISGPAQTGNPVTSDRISVLVANGVYLDTTSGDGTSCTTTYSQVTAKAVAGEAVCRVSQPVATTVRVQFRAG